MTPDNLKRLLDDMGQGPGWYASGDLYRWYVGMCQEGGMDPVTQRKFGAVLREMKYQSALRRVDGKNARCWFISRRAFRGQEGAHG